MTIAMRIKKYLAWAVVNIPILALSLSCIYPVVWLLYSSLKTDQEFAVSPVALPKILHFGNYITAFARAKFSVFFFNSLLNSIASLLLVLVISFVMGYLLSRYRFPGRNLIYMILMAGIMIPVYALIVPIFIQFKNIGLLNNRFTLVPIYVAFELPTAIFLIDGYLKGISVDLEEAATIDGAGMPRVMFSIMLPVCRPIMMTVVILTFMHVWNEFPFAQVMINKEALKTIPIGLTYFTSQYMTQYTLLLAALAMATIPVLTIYLFFYNKIMEGMMAGAIKG
ncbi:raffinose/stachyose/melibiose transport system permease protein [Anaerocolumna jejuensis DSM 15929]|jgi:raffinose/stachyose/melibiose transport system permease protein|uniref:Raffinose/stachyose/melibiose transport system permease protein n=1 Tax=Anaerocolumna jejuensis DSM 15929 TaxID=1121322 RepID=A0A1M6TIQ6_9FIRM|nr:carbohydrate ABC transporter permease [Anaerocolumna jejuensis]SHK56875.1 raffinose/stachyose/melibiose transport system permease protein [Anaerocolumna jejuensis DSM 15929]